MNISLLLYENTSMLLCVTLTRIKSGIQLIMIMLLADVADRFYMVHWNII